MSYNLSGHAGAVGFTGVLSRAGAATANLVRGGAATTVTSQNTTYAINGKLYYSASGTIGSTTPTTDAVTGLAFVPLQKQQGCVYVYCLDTAGALKLLQGPLPPTVAGVTGKNCDIAGNFVDPPQFPAIPATLCPLSYVVVHLASTYVGTGWIIGTSNFTGITGVTAETAVDLVTLPPSPQTT